MKFLKVHLWSSVSWDIRSGQVKNEFYYLLPPASTQPASSPTSGIYSNVTFQADLS